MDPLEQVAIMGNQPYLPWSLSFLMNFSFIMETTSISHISHHVSFESFATDIVSWQYAPWSVIVAYQCWLCYRCCACAGSCSTRTIWAVWGSSNRHHHDAKTAYHCSSSSTSEPSVPAGFRARRLQSGRQRTLFWRVIFFGGSLGLRKKYLLSVFNKNSTIKGSRGGGPGKREHAQEHTGTWTCSHAKRQPVAEISQGNWRPHF